MPAGKNLCENHRLTRLVPPLALPPALSSVGLVLVAVFMPPVPVGGQIADPPLLPFLRHFVHRFLNGGAPPTPAPTAAHPGKWFFVFFVSYQPVIPSLKWYHPRWTENMNAAVRGAPPFTILKTLRSLVQALRMETVSGSRGTDDLRAFCAFNPRLISA